MDFNFDPADLREFFNLHTPEDNAKKFHGCVV